MSVPVRRGDLEVSIRCLGTSTAGTAALARYTHSDGREQIGNPTQAGTGFGKGVQDGFQELLQLVAGTQPHNPRWEEISLPLAAEAVAEYKRGGVYEREQ